MIISRLLVPGALAGGKHLPVSDVVLYSRATAAKITAMLAAFANMLVGLVARPVTTTDVVLLLPG